MTVLEKSPLYQQILEKGKQEGLERGVIRVLQRRFGQLPPGLSERLEELPVAELEELLDEALIADKLAAFAGRLTAVENRTR